MMVGDGWMIVGSPILWSTIFSRSLSFMDLAAFPKLIHNT